VSRVAGGGEERSVKIIMSTKNLKKDKDEPEKMKARTLSAREKELVRVFLAGRMSEAETFFADFLTFIGRQEWIDAMALECAEEIRQLLLNIRGTITAQLDE
jgi:hypothetical protein